MSTAPEACYDDVRILASPDAAAESEADLKARTAILYCNCSNRSLVPSDRKEEARDMLGASGRPLVVVEDLCALAATRDDLLAGLARAGRLVVVACYPRAVKWLFHYASAPLDEGSASILNMRRMSPDEILASVNEALDGRPEVPRGAPRHPQPAAGASGASWGQIDFAKPDGLRAASWFPVLDRDRCVNCGQCQSFCPFGVYERDDANAVVVANPAHCKDNCPACARLCPHSAIIFPKYDKAPINGADPTGPVSRPPAAVLDEAPEETDLHKLLARRRQRLRSRLGEDADRPGKEASEE